MATIEHFEIPADNVERAKKFYEEMFGWKITKTPMAKVEYWIIETQDDQGQKGLRGGMCKRVALDPRSSGIARPDAMSQMPGLVPCTYVAVDDADAYAKKVVELGGKVMHLKDEPGVGKFAMFLDTEGNMVSVWQRASRPKA